MMTMMASLCLTGIFQTMRGLWKKRYDQFLFHFISPCFSNRRAIKYTCNLSGGWGPGEAETPSETESKGVG